jgi:hypothetical protein
LDSISAAVPLVALTFQDIKKGGMEVLEEFENLTDVRFVEFESTVQSSPVVLVKVKV